MPKKAFMRHRNSKSSPFFCRINKCNQVWHKISGKVFQAKLSFWVPHQQPKWHNSIVHRLIPPKGRNGVLSIVLIYLCRTFRLDQRTTRSLFTNCNGDVTVFSMFFSGSSEIFRTIFHFYGILGNTKSLGVNLSCLNFFCISQFQALPFPQGNPGDLTKIRVQGTGIWPKYQLKANGN